MSHNVFYLYAFLKREKENFRARAYVRRKTRFFVDLNCILVEIFDISHICGNKCWNRVGHVTSPILVEIRISLVAIVDPVHNDFQMFGDVTL